MGDVCSSVCSSIEEVPLQAFASSKEFSLEGVICWTEDSIVDPGIFDSEWDSLRGQRGLLLLNKR